jgi:hypothetical protein
MDDQSGLATGCGEVQVHRDSITALKLSLLLGLVD